MKSDNMNENILKNSQDLEKKFHHNISVIICTMPARREELRETLESILRQTIQPHEVLVVSESEEVETFLHSIAKLFKKKRIKIMFILNTKKSLTVARNNGVKHATGDILLFLDDDVILEKNYIEEIQNVYKQDNAVAVQGYITNLVAFSFPSKLVNKILFNTHKEKNVNRLLPSVQNVYAVPLTKKINCEWMIGANSSYLREIVEEMGGFDERLLRWSAGEDDDLSYRIFKKYPGRIFQTPKARLIHKLSVSGRLPNETISLMGEIYHKYLFYKNIDQTIINKIIWLFNKLGRLLRATKRFFLNPGVESFLKLKYMIKANMECIYHSKEIKIGDLDFFNKRLE